MELRELKSLLMNHADATMKLAEKLDIDGVRLQDHEKQLIRMAMVPTLAESMDMVKSSFVIGNEKWLEEEMGRLRSYLEMPL